jgi:large subunit ribosomal protein L10
MNRTEKAEAVDTLKGLFSKAGVVVVSRYSGLTVKEMTALRGRLREAGASLKVVNNRLVKIAIDGTPMAAGSQLFTGPTVIAYSADPVAATKVAAAYAKEKDKFVIIGGLMGDTLLDEKGVKTLAELPSLDQLRGKLIGLIQAPATKVAGVLAAPAGQLARVIGAYAAKEDQPAAA